VQQQPLLVADRLTKTIAGKTIVRGVSFTLSAGEVFGFLGPNGAGKTTTIRMLVGLIRPTSGTVRIMGHDIQSDFEAAMSHVGCIVETPDLYRFMTGRENLEHFARMLGPVDPDEVERLASMVALSHRLDDRVRTYSLGMRQRLGIAQALLGSPRILILDEPANGLDPAGIREMRQLLRSLAQERGMCVLVSSHLLAEVQLMCDRVAIIHRGEILQSGLVRDLITATSEVEFAVDQPQMAVALARGLGFDPAVDDGLLRLSIDADQTASLLTAFAAGGVKVYRAQPRQQTLEEMFLEATGGETVSG
jgi:ABC-2 type transport system ATP-binding protein